MPKSTLDSLLGLQTPEERKAMLNKIAQQNSKLKKPENHESELRKQFPELYGFLGSFLGTAPDEFSGSVLDPNTARVRAGAEYGFPTGIVAQMLPVGLPVSAKLATIPGPAAGGMLSQRGVVKLPGGNWLNLMNDDAKNALHKYKRPVYDNDPKVAAEKTEALGNWVDKNLVNYIRKDMATPNDPVRKLAEEGISHLPENAFPPNRLNNIWNLREETGFPLAHGVSREAQLWELLADNSISSAPVKKYTSPLTESERKRGLRSLVDTHPWLTKVDPESFVSHFPDYTGGSSVVDDLGFDHIIDVLRQDLAAGRIRPENLKNLSVEKAVRRTHQFDQEMAEKMAATQAKITEGMPVHKEYDDGYKWIELTKPKAKLAEGETIKHLPEVDMWGIYDSQGGAIGSGATQREAMGLLRRKEREKMLEDALKYEGDAMGHCVGGYCPDVAEGKTRIFSLRDSKGRPHVTVELTPSGSNTIKSLKEGKPTEFDINQIKGKQNNPPIAKYLPYVQDFVKGGTWGEVKELSNAGLRDLSKTPRLQKWAQDTKKSTGRFVSEEEYSKLENAFQSAETDSLANQLLEFKGLDNDLLNNPLE